MLSPLSPCCLYCCLGSIVVSIVPTTSCCLRRPRCLASIVVSTLPAASCRLRCPCSLLLSPLSPLSNVVSVVPPCLYCCQASIVVSVVAVVSRCLCHPRCLLLSPLSPLSLVVFVVPVVSVAASPALLSSTDPAVCGSSLSCFAFLCCYPLC